MSDAPKQKDFIGQMLEELGAKKVPPSQWPQSLSSILAERIDFTLNADTRKPLETLNESLELALRPALQCTTQSVVAAVLGNEKADPSLRDAFILGMLSFAQEVIASAVNRRADDRTVEEIRGLMREPTLRELLEALDRDELSREELASRFARPLETVEQQVRQFSKLGLVEWRRRQEQAYFFATPLGIQALSLDAS